MSAVIVIKQSKAAHVLTDTAAYGASGDIRFQCPKLWPLPHLRTVIAARGALGALSGIIEVSACRCITYDQLRTEMGARLRSACALHEAALALADRGPAIELFVVGVTEAGNLDAFAISNLARDWAPWTPRPLGTFALTPGDAAVHAELKRAFPRGFESADHIDPTRDGIRIMEIQRRAQIVPMGAAVQKTTMDVRGRITMEIVHEWSEDVEKLKRDDKRHRDRIAESWDEADAAWEAMQ